jgi:hypothetical protein
MQNPTNGLYVFLDDATYQHKKCVCLESSKDTNYFPNHFEDGKEKLKH